jgi:hypothetical protein
MSVKYKKSFPITVPGLLANLLILGIVLLAMAFENANFVYTEKEVDDE